LIDESCAFLIASDLRFQKIVESLTPIRNYFRCPAACAAIGGGAVRCDELGSAFWPPPPLLPQLQISVDATKASSSRDFMV